MYCKTATAITFNRFFYRLMKPGKNSLENKPQLTARKILDKSGGFNPLQAGELLPACRQAVRQKPAATLQSLKLYSRSFGYVVAPVLLF